MAERLFSTYQVADLLGATAADVVEWMRKGWLSYRQMPSGPIRISESNLVQFLKDRGVDMAAIMAKVAAEESTDTEAAPAALSSPDRPAVQLQDAPARTSPAATSPEPQAARSDSVEQVLQAVFREAMRLGASDIHLEPAPDGLGLRLRVDGVLHEKASFKARLPKDLPGPIMRRLAELAGVGAGKAAGEFATDVNGRQLRLRLSLLSLPAGTRAVLHVIDPSRDLPDLRAMEFAGIGKGQVLRLLEGSGLIVLACPPRVGAELVLGAAVNYLNTRSRCLFRIRHRIDHEIPLLAQVLADGPGLASTAEVLSALGGQDADAAVIDDLADASTAAALEFARSGRLALAGVDARDALEAVQSLENMQCNWAGKRGLAAVLAARSVRKLCLECKKPGGLEADALELLSLDAQDFGPGVRQAAGCAACGGMGYRGSLMLVEMIPGEPALLAALAAGDGAAIRQAEASLTPMLRTGLDLVGQGVTSLQELARVLCR